MVLGTQPPPIANFGFETTGTNCAAILFNCTGPFFPLPGGSFSELSYPLPHCEFWIRNNGNQLCSNCADILFNCTCLFFQLPGGWFSELTPPPHCEFRIRSNGNQLCSTVNTVEGNSGMPRNSDSSDCVMKKRTGTSERLSLIHI